jgi:DNA-binding transcriptional regulator PaaX
MRSPLLALFAQLPAALPLEPKPERARYHEAGSATSAVLQCVEHSCGGIQSGEVARITGLSSSVVRTALNRLEHLGELERTNEESPYLYRKTSAAHAA